MVSYWAMQASKHAGSDRAVQHLLRHLCHDFVCERATSEIANKSASMENLSNGERQHTEALYQRPVAWIVDVHGGQGHGRLSIREE